MTFITDFISNGHPSIAWVAMIAAFAILAKSADIFVESSVAIAERMHIPKLVIGIVLVSLATTAPELTVSLMSAIAGKPEMALGNAAGSVICNCGLALALCGILSASPIHVLPQVLKTAGPFLIGVCVLAYVFTALDRTLSRIEGAILMSVFFAYIGFLVHQYRTGKIRESINLSELEDECSFPLPKVLILFAVALTGILLSSRLVIVSAMGIARSFGIPESVIALTLVALGTSFPEVATSITAARKGEGELAVGNILGANIMNVCWVAGASAMANDLTLGLREIQFMFPAMGIIVIVTLWALRSQHRLSRKEGLLLLGLYAAYVASFFIVFRGPAP